MNKRSSSKRNLKCDAKISGCHVIHVCPSGTVYQYNPVNYFFLFTSVNFLFPIYNILYVAVVLLKSILGVARGKHT